MTLTIARKIPVDVWRRFIDIHPRGNVFQTPEIAEVFRCANYHQPLLFAAINGKEEITSLILAVQVKTISCLPSRFVSRCIVFGGILHPLDGCHESISRLFDSLDSVVKSSSMFTEIRNITCDEDFKNQIGKCGYSYFNYLNYLVPLDRDPEEIFQDFSRSRKQNLRKLEKMGFFVEEVARKDDTKKIYDILKSTYSRIRVPLADISLFHAIYEILKPLGMAKFYLVKSGEEQIAAAIALLYKKTIYLWYLGTKKEYHKANPSSLIVWHIMKWGSQNGYRTLDFLGAGRPEKPYGVREFKRRFGGIQVDYGRYQKIYSPLLLRISEKAYGLYRKLL